MNQHIGQSKHQSNNIESIDHQSINEKSIRNRQINQQTKQSIINQQIKHSPINHWSIHQIQIRTKQSINQPTNHEERARNHRIRQMETNPTNQSKQKDTRPVTAMFIPGVSDRPPLRRNAKIKTKKQNKKYTPQKIWISLWKVNTNGRYEQNSLPPKTHRRSWRQKPLSTISRTKKKASIY